MIWGTGSARGPPESLGAGTKSVTKLFGIIVETSPVPGSDWFQRNGWDLGVRVCVSSSLSPEVVGSTHDAFMGLVVLSIAASYYYIF